MSVPLCYYGSPDPLPPRRRLRVGPLTAVYEAGDLRYVKVGGVEVCRRWYAAVRDHNWGTVPGVISDEAIEETADGFRVTYTSTHRQGDIHFVWRAEIVASTDLAWSSFGSIPAVTVTFRFDGESLTTFRRNRIGFCVLHPPTHAGLPVWVHHPDGSITTNLAYPDLISPDNPFREVRMIQPQSSHQPWWTFDGDVFETEDQRNWIDASFKTFCTPLRLPFPVEVKAGEQVRQTVTMSAIGGGVDAQPVFTLTRVDGPIHRLPAIGLGVSSDRPPTAAELGWIRQLRPAHLRADLDLSRLGWQPRLRSAAEQAVAVGCGLELAVTVSDAAAETVALIPELLVVAPPVERVLVVRAADWSTHEEDVGPVVEAFARAGLHPDVFGGTTANFTELNRRRPPLNWVQGIGYSVQPQEHAFDNASLVECCAVLADTVRSARAFGGDRPLSVGPVTLRKRVNPYATGPWEPPPPDPRQTSLFGAGWTLAAVKYLAESGVEFVTLYEAAGPRGVVDWGTVFAVWTVLHDLADFAGAEVLPTRSSDPLAFDGLTLRRGDRRRVLLANLSDRERSITLTDLPPAVTVRVFDETCWTPMTACPDYWWEQEAPQPTTTTAGRLPLTLRPYAYARVDG